ncbi:hypothetical protein L198_08300 [Cryptococcus wingfieldii CBS 7118]|nr:hypothetical protein L198_08300 [Cryptococcus wingfieldii CBS 7118]ODN73103.1 hypothetical protein L198_08300 [Cryptococcus wingfieldii CBS 7118]
MVYEAIQGQGIEHDLAYDVLTGGTMMFAGKSRHMVDIDLFPPTTRLVNGDDLGDHFCAYQQSFAVVDTAPEVERAFLMTVGEKWDELQGGKDVVGAEKIGDVFAEYEPEADAQGSGDEDDDIEFIEKKKENKGKKAENVDKAEEKQRERGAGKGKKVVAFWRDFRGRR